MLFRRNWVPIVSPIDEGLIPPVIIRPARMRALPIETAFVRMTVVFSSRIGVRKARYRASLPSEPDWRISRIRLSGRWFTDKRGRRLMHRLPSWRIAYVQ